MKLIFDGTFPLVSMKISLWDRLKVMWFMLNGILDLCAYRVEIDCVSAVPEKESK